MRKIIAITVLTVLTLAAFPVTAATNLVVNGGFEEPVVTDAAQWDIFPDGTTGLGWTVQWRGDIPGSWGGHTRPDPSLQELHHGVNGWLPHGGDQYAELDTDWDGPGGGLNGEPASVIIYQDLSTGAGCEYELTFYFSPRPGTPESDNNLEVSWDGTVLDTISRAGNSQTDWSEHTYTVTATGSTTRLQFTDLGDANSLGTFLDDVSVEEISCPCPEPSVQINIGNCAMVKNIEIVKSNTGGNGIANSEAMGGDSEADDNDDNSILTGNAIASAASFTIANSNISRGCCGNQINIGNRAMVKNVQISEANTGFNGIGNSTALGGDSETDDNDGNIIVTGHALSEASIVNIINSNIQRGFIR